MSETEEIVELLLRTAPQLATQAHLLLSPVADARDELRAQLVRHNLLVTFPTEHDMPVTIGAVDGGSVREHLYAADLLVAAATSANGLTSTHLPVVSHEWAHIVTHQPENDRLLSAAMASLELKTLAEIGHDLRILDGSFRTPLIALTAALMARSPLVAEASANLFDDTLFEAIGYVCSAEHIVALPKADSAHQFTDHYKNLFNISIPGGDKFLATQVLQPGEMLYPLSATAQLNVGTTHAATPETRQLAARFTELINPLRIGSQQRQLLVTYAKPHKCETVTKMEYRTTEPLPEKVDVDHSSVVKGQQLASMFSAETVAPHIQEPFAQYAVDRAAKTVSIGANAVTQAMLGLLPAGSDRYIHLLTRGYRT